MRRHGKILLLVLAAAAVLAVLPAARADVDPVQAELDRVHDLYRAITSYHVLLQGEGVTREQVEAALYDVEHYVQELDNRYATDKLFIDDHRALEEITRAVAKAHFEAALMHARGVDLEGSITQYEKVIDLLGYDPVEWDEQIERAGRPGLLPEAGETVFEIVTPRQAVEDLKHFWAAGVVTRFKVREYNADQRQTLHLKRIGGRNDAFSQAAFDLAAKRFEQRVSAGLEEFRVVLPLGIYRVESTDPTVHPLEFRLLKGGVPDPIILNPNSFSFEIVSQDERCIPQFTLNGLPVRELQAIPYGTYRVHPPKTCNRRLPDKITVEQNSEVTLRTEPEKLDYVKEGQPIFLYVTTPPGSTYTLRF